MRQIEEEQDYRDRMNSRIYDLQVRLENAQREIEELKADKRVLVKKNRALKNKTFELNTSSNATGK
jgi:predicted RNase H-like nuclease (RuvC/YqgF family)